MYLFLVVLGLRRCARAFSNCGEWGLLFTVAHRLYTEVASLTAEHGLYAHGLQQLWYVGLDVPRHVESPQTRESNPYIIQSGGFLSTVPKRLPKLSFSPMAMSWDYPKPYELSQYQFHGLENLNYGGKREK